MISRTWPRPRRLTNLLALGCVALCVVIAIELTAAPATAPGDGAATRPAAAAAGAHESGFAMPPANSYADIEARPLFSDTRRPSASAADAAQQVQPNFVLVGTILSHDEHDALIKHGKPARVEHVTEGQSVDGWTVHSILADRVIFTNAGTRLEIKTKDDDVAAAPPGRKRHVAADADTGSTGE